MMNLTVRIPDDLAKRLGAGGADLERKALEALVLEEFRGNRLTTHEVREALGFETLDEVDGFLKKHAVYEPCSVEDINRQVDSLARLGF